ncbi:MAG: anti-sigma factor [bacterium]|nr:anti-sigma factor [bacterium]
MNREEYISSGILESYLLEELSPREALEVERQLRFDPELRQELEKIEKTLYQMSESASVKPPLDLKDSIFSEIEKEETIQMSSPSGSYFKFLMAAGVTLFLISSVIAYNYWNKWQTSNKELISLRDQNQVLAQDLQKVNNEYSAVEDDLFFISQPNTQIVAINGLAISSTSSGTIYWNPGEQKVLLKVNSLPEPPEGKQYQLWAIVDGQPTDLGVFDIGNEFLSIRNVKNPSAFAVTLENEGGSPVPTLDQMYLLGEVS